jgi:hypothetical protein
MPATLIAGARLLDPATGLDAPGDLLLESGTILDHGTGLSRPDGAEVVDAAGLCLAPGLIDLRAALGEPGAEHRETIASAAQAPSRAASPRSAPCPTPTRHWTTRRWCSSCSARGGDGLHHPAALRRRHQGCAGRRWPNTVYCARPARSLHRRQRERSAARG